MASIEIVNVSGGCLNLPYPLRGFLEPNESVVIDTTMAELTEALGDTKHVLEFREQARGEPNAFAKGDLGAENLIQFEQVVGASLLGRVQSGITFEQEVECTIEGRITSGVAPIPPDEITDVTVLAWYDLTASMRFLAALAGFGASPPAGTLSGTLTPGLGLFLKTGSVAGARGTANISGSLDNGATFPMVNVVTDDVTGNMDLGLAPPNGLGVTGLTVNFADAAFNSNNTWEARTDQITDVINSHVFASPAQRPGIRGPGASDNLLDEFATRHDGTATRLELTAGTLPTDLCGGSANSFYIAMIVDLKAVPSIGTMICFGSSGSTDRRVELLATTSAWRMRRRSAAGAEKVLDTTTAPSTGINRIEFWFDGTNAFLRVNGVLLSTIDNPGGGASTDLNTGVSSISLNQGSIGLSFIGGSRQTWAQIDMHRLVCMASIPTTQLAGFREWLGAP